MTAAPLATAGTAVTSGTKLWTARFNGSGNNLSRDDIASSIAASLNGKLVFVTGYSPGKLSVDYVTVAYNAATGAAVWLKRYNGPDGMGDLATSLAVSPSGNKVFVTGGSQGSVTGFDYLTVAYSAATGAKLWVKRYNGPGVGNDHAESVAVSPGGGNVFVTGYSPGTNSGDDYATVAYSAATGAQLWMRRYNGPFNNNDGASSVGREPRHGLGLCHRPEHGRDWLRRLPHDRLQRLSRAGQHDRRLRRGCRQPVHGAAMQPGRGS